VVIPVRDRADVVGRAVASVLAQTFASVEVVVVDDGSTDDSVAAARAVADGRVRIVRQDPAGVEAARRSGVERSHGRWILVLDPDDEVAPGWLARISRLVDSTGAVLVSCGGEQVHADGSATVVAPTAVGDPADRVLACFRPGAFAVRRDLLAAVGSFGGPDGTETLAQVGERLVRAVLDDGSTMVSTPEALVRWNEPSAEDSPCGEYLRLRWALQSLDALARTPIPDAELMVRSATIGGIAAVRLGEHREARRLFALARGVAPDVPRLWARWAVSCVPPVAARVWAPIEESAEESAEAPIDAPSGVAAPDEPATATPEPAK
jgi:hypothetical protein